MSFTPANKEALITAVNGWCSVPQNTVSYNGVPINDWDTSLIDDMSELFQNKTTFNDNISNSDTSNVTNMRVMFYGVYF